MSKSLLRGAFAFLLLASTWLAVSSRSPAQETPRADMQKLANSLSKVLPLVIDDDAYRDKDNQRYIIKSLKSMANAAHRIEDKLTVANDDPIMSLVPVRMARNFELAAQRLRRGHAERARGLVMNATAYCISCHTRTVGGAASISLDPDISGARKEMSLATKAEFYAATRQFDKAILSYEALLNDPSYAVKFPHRWEAAVKKMLAIVIRVQRSAPLTLELIAQIREAQSVPIALQRDAAIWQVSAKSWRHESLATDSPATSLLDTAKSHYQNGEQLVTQTGSADAGLVSFLRASSELHDFLAHRQNNDLYAEGLLLAGKTAQRLGSLNLGTLAETYYEACVRLRPHTMVAQQCFAQYQLSQGRDASGPGGQAILTAEAAARRRELEKLAQ